MTDKSKKGTRTPHRWLRIYKAPSTGVCRVVNIHHATVCETKPDSGDAAGNAEEVLDQMVKLWNQKYQHPKP